MSFMAVDGSPIRASTRRLCELAAEMCVGDLVFIRCPYPPFTAISTATDTWTNHVGIVIDRDSKGPVVAESRLPFSRRTPIADYVRRSQHGRIAVLRARLPLSNAECLRLRAAADARLGRLYDTGFNLDSRRQFCSRYVREVLEAAGRSIGAVHTFEELLARRPRTDLRTWRLWYFGRIPWKRRTVTPASLYGDAALRTVFDGRVTDACQRHHPARANGS